MAGNAGLGVWEGGGGPGELVGRYGCSVDADQMLGWSWDGEWLRGEDERGDWGRVRVGCCWGAGEEDGFHCFRA